MDEKRAGWALGLALVVLGVLLLLQALGVALGRWLFGLLLLGAGGGFLAAYLQGRYGWASIPGLGLLGLALALFLEGQAWAGSLFLLGLGAGLIATYLADRAQWWALIPGGILLSLAGVALVEGLWAVEAGWLLFLGMALTFAALCLLGHRFSPMAGLGDAASPGPHPRTLAAFSGLRPSLGPDPGGGVSPLA